jgi:nitrogen-specific signal transduction histidine kinase
MATHSCSVPGAPEEDDVEHDRLRSVGLLTAGLAHELRNPLSLVLVTAEEMLGTAASGNASANARRGQRQLKLVRREALRAARLIESVLAYARGGAPEPERVAVVEAIAEARELWQLSRRPHWARMSWRPGAEGVGWVWAPRGALEQVLLNLFLNAEQALARCGRRGTITVRLLTGDTCIGVEVADDGPGLPEAVRRRLFQPLPAATHRLCGGAGCNREARGGHADDSEANRVRPAGTGLGLFVAHSLVRSMGGLIRVDTSDRGTCFRIELPLGGRERRLREYVVPTAPAIRETRLPARRLLLIEDDHAVLDFLVAVLQRRGHRVDVARSPHEALRRLELAEQHPMPDPTHNSIHDSRGGGRNAVQYDAVLSDWCLGDGIAAPLLERIERRHPALAGRIVLLSGCPPSDPALGRFCGRRGIPLLQKPFTVAELDHALGNICGGEAENTCPALSPTHLTD